MYQAQEIGGFEMSCNANDKKVVLKCLAMQMTKFKVRKYCLESFLLFDCSVNKILTYSAILQRKTNVEMNF